MIPTQKPQVDVHALPCPFCGSPAEAELWHGGAPTKTMIQCSSYGCSVRPSSCEETYDHALAIWNIRATGLTEMGDADRVEGPERRSTLKLLVRFSDPENFIAPDLNEEEQALILKALAQMARVRPARAAKGQVRG